MYQTQLLLHRKPLIIKIVEVDVKNWSDLLLVDCGWNWTQDPPLPKKLRVPLIPTRGSDKVHSGVVMLCCRSVGCFYVDGISVNINDEGYTHLCTNSLCRINIVASVQLEILYQRAHNRCLTESVLETVALEISDTNVHVDSYFNCVDVNKKQEMSFVNAFDLGIRGRNCRGRLCIRYEFPG
ncbi:hypothetical protein BJV82DRAFT_582362 [Fennellomyces sp. T-0311]|nr:hypothetical protein BJV82DRAFT_582362 [Fennellomyces sp. T-0311]